VNPGALSARRLLLVRTAHNRLVLLCFGTMAMARVVAQTVGAGVVRRSAFATARAVLRTGTVLCDTPVALASCARLHTVAVDGVPPEVAEAMPRCIRELVGSQALVGETVTVQGWVRSCRAQKTVRR